MHQRILGKTGIAVSELGLGGLFLSKLGTSLDERRWAVQDANMNVVAILDESKNAAERFVYDACGKRTAVLDNDYEIKTGGSDFAWTVGFQGMAYDSITGLYHSRVRSEYSPTLGRWLIHRMLRNLLS